MQKSGPISCAASATGLTSNHHCCNALNVICKDRELPPVLGHHARHVFIEHVLLQCDRGAHFSSSARDRVAFWARMSGSQRNLGRLLARGQKTFGMDVGAAYWAAR